MEADILGEIINSQTKPKGLSNLAPVALLSSGLSPNVSISLKLW